MKRSLICGFRLLVDCPVAFSKVHNPLPFFFHFFQPFFLFSIFHVGRARTRCTFSRLLRTKYVHAGYTITFTHTNNYIHQVPVLIYLYLQVQNMYEHACWFRLFVSFYIILCIFFSFFFHFKYECMRQESTGHKVITKRHRQRRRINIGPGGCGGQGCREEKRARRSSVSVYIIPALGKRENASKRCVEREKKVPTSLSHCHDDSDSTTTADTTGTVQLG